jgi:hypothetical protein
MRAVVSVNVLPLVDPQFVLTVPGAVSVAAPWSDSETNTIGSAPVLVCARIFA